MLSDNERTIILDGENLSLDDLGLLDLQSTKVTVSEEAWNRVRDGRNVIDDILKSGKKVYGINTGFGALADVQIDSDKLATLQENLIRFAVLVLTYKVPCCRSWRAIDSSKNKKVISIANQRTCKRKKWNTSRNRSVFSRCLQ